MSLRAKLLLAQAPLALAVVVLGFVSVATVSSLARRSEGILQDNYRSVLAAQRMKESLERIQDSAAMSVLGGDRASWRAQANEQCPRFDAELRVAESNLTEPGEGETTARLRQFWTAYQATLDRFFAAPEDASARALLGDLERTAVSVRQAADDILAMNQDAMVRKSDRARSEAESVSLFTIGVAFAALLIGGVLSVWTTTRLIRPLGLLTRTVEQIGRGDFAARVTVPGRDEVAQLASDINAMAQRLDQYRRSSLGELLLAQQSSQAAIDSLPDAIVVFDIGGSVLNVNEAAEELFPLAGAANRTEAMRSAAPAVWAVVERARQHVLAGHGPYAPKSFDDAVRLEGPGAERWVLPRATPLYAEERGIAGVTVVLQDVTRLRRVDELRSDLVATVAHEFRTPLTSLRMALHLCLNEAAGPLTAKQVDLLEAARDDCERLQAMVDELLDLARIQGGRIELRQRATSPAALIDAAVDSIRTAAQEARLTLAVEVMPGLPDVSADRERIQLVLGNLLGNALRHTPPDGQLGLRARANGAGVRFEVSDSGEGIAAEHQRSIFEKFFRVPGGSSGSAGIGLSLAKEIVQAHGGEIGVDSAVGHGATFWFTLPRA